LGLISRCRGPGLREGLIIMGWVTGAPRVGVVLVSQANGVFLVVLVIIILCLGNKPWISFVVLAPSPAAPSFNPPYPPHPRAGHPSPS
jgi:hypothetical protein